MLACEPIRIDGVDGNEFFVQKVTLSNSHGIVAVVKPKKPVEGCTAMMITIPGQTELSKRELIDIIREGIADRLKTIRREKIVRKNRQHLKDLVNHFNGLLGIHVASARFH